MFSQSEENYIKAIYHLALKEPNGVSTNSIAGRLDTKASSVTDMVKKLSEKNLVIYKKYQGVVLTELGKTIAINVIRKQRLWEVFLVQKLNFSWDEVHEVAEHLEHIKSQKLIDELDAFLGYPKIDPHGDPIPDKDGRMQDIDKVLVSNCEQEQKGECIAVNDTSPEFLQFLDKQGIELGKQIKIISKEPFDNSFIIEIESKQIPISNKIASNLFIHLEK